MFSTRHTMTSAISMGLPHLSFTLRCSPLYVRARSETFVDFAMGLPVATSTVEPALRE